MEGRRVRVCGHPRSDSSRPVARGRHSASPNLSGENSQSWIRPEDPGRYGLTGLGAVSAQRASGVGERTPCDVRVTGGPLGRVFGRRPSFFKEHRGATRVVQSEEGAGARPRQSSLELETGAISEISSRGPPATAVRTRNGRPAPGRISLCSTHCTPGGRSPELGPPKAAVLGLRLWTSSVSRVRTAEPGLPWVPMSPTRRPPGAPCLARAGPSRLQGDGCAPACAVPSLTPSVGTREWASRT